MMFRNARVAFAVFAATLGFSGPSALAADAPIEINYGYPTVDHVNIYVAQDLGLFEKAGLRPKFYTFQSGAPLLAALKSDSLDVVTGGLGLAFALGQNIPLKIILWNSNDAAGEGLVASAGAIRSYTDIGKAQRIGAATGTCAQVALYLMAKKVGVPYSQLNVINIPAPLMRNSFLSNSIDAGIAWAPYSMMLDTDPYKLINWDPDYVPLGGVCPRMTAVRPAFMKAHPTVGEKLIEVDALASEAVARNPQIAIDALAKRLGLDAAIAKATIEKVYAPRPTYAQQLDANSPYSLTAKDGGLAKTLLLATQVLFEVKAIPEALAPAVIQDAIDPSALKAYQEKSGTR